MSLLGVANCHDNRYMEVDLTGGTLGQVTVDAKDPYVGIRSYCLTQSETEPNPADYIKWNGKTKLISVANNTPEYLWVKNGRGLTTKKIFSIHAHTGNSTSGGGCYTKPNYHVHVGNSSTRGGCFTIEKHRTDILHYNYASSTTIKYGFKITSIGSVVDSSYDGSNYFGRGYGANITLYFCNWRGLLYLDEAKTSYIETTMYHIYALWNSDSRANAVSHQSNYYSVGQVLTGKNTIKKVWNIHIITFLSITQLIQIMNQLKREYQRGVHLVLVIRQM